MNGCLSVLALQQTGNLSRVCSTFCPMKARIGCSLITTSTMIGRMLLILPSECEPVCVIPERTKCVEKLIILNYFDCSVGVAKKGKKAKRQSIN